MNNSQPEGDLKCRLKKQTPKKKNIYDKNILEEEELILDNDKEKSAVDWICDKEREIKN